MTRQRQCKRESDGAVLDPDDCGGGPIIFETGCNTHKCASWTDWGSWSCPVICGPVITNTRSRSCNDTQTGNPLVCTVNFIVSIHSFLLGKIPRIKDNSHCALFGDSGSQTSGSCGGISCPGTHIYYINV